MQNWRTWTPPLVLFIALLLALAGIWIYGGGFCVIKEYHIVAASLVGFVVGLPLLLWRTLVASTQLATSNKIADTANKSRANDILVNGANMIGASAPETTWVGINILIGLVDEDPEYMESVVPSFCAFLRPEVVQSGGIIQKPNEQNVRIFEAMNRWLKSDAWVRDTRLDLRRVWVIGIRLDSIRLNVDMSGGQIQRSCINGVDFSGSDFSKNRGQFTCTLTSLKDCKFDRANLTGARFRGVDFTGCTFDGADISGIKLYNEGDAKLVVTKAQLEDAHWDSDNPPDIPIGIHDANTGEPLSLWLAARKNQNS